jgi:hypothetical protein
VPAREDALEREGVAVPHDGVGVHDAVRGPHAARAPAVADDPRDVRAVLDAPAELAHAPLEVQHELVDPARAVPGAEGVLHVARDGQRGGRPPRIGAGVGGEALGHGPQPRVAERRAGERAQRVPRLDPDQVARIGRGLAGPRSGGRERGRPGEERHGRAPHARADPEEARPVGSRARRPRLERLEGGREVGGEVQA